MKLPSLDLHSLTLLAGSAACLAFAAADLWYFHSLAKDTDLTLLLAGLGSLGISSAYGAGLRSDPSPASPVAAPRES